MNTSRRRAVPVVDYTPRTMVGIYHWNPDYQAYPGTPDRLTWGAGLVRGVGARTTRIVVSPSDPYGPVAPGAMTLRDTAESAPYRALFEDPETSVYLLTVYTAADLVNSWADGFDAAERDRETAEVAALGEHLLERYPGKTFIVLNWEGDNALRGVGATPQAVLGFLGWIEARAEGVRLARERRGDGAATLYSGLEYNRVFDCDTAPCVITEVAPRVSVDYYSYSSYEAINVPTAEIPDTLRRAMSTAFDAVTRTRPTVGRHQFILGEVGWPREGIDFGECDTADRVGVTLSAARDWGVSYAVMWQIIDNARGPSDLFVGYGLYRADGNITLAGRTLNEFLATGTFPARTVTSCPAVSGVTDSAARADNIPGGALITIRGSALSSGTGAGMRGATVHVAQPGSQVDLREGSPGWSETASEIRTQLPLGLTAGVYTVVWVTRGDGIDSDGFVFTAAAPAMGACGNGAVDLGEACDGGPCCAPDCRVRPAGVVCRAAADATCDAAESCAGSAACPPDTFAPDGTTCAAGRCAIGACVASTCGNGIVEPGEQCDGGSCCAGCMLAAPGTTCRPSAHPQCDVAELCSGFSGECPADGRAPDGFDCPGGTCRAGTCTSCVPTCPATGCGGGPDGCAGTCPPLLEGEACPGGGGVCRGGMCVTCTPSCSPTACGGFDGCGGTCPAREGLACGGGVCRSGVCTPTCVVTCPGTGCGGGMDGCGGMCPPAHEGEVCADGICQAGMCRPRLAAVVDGAVGTSDISPDSVLTLYGTFAAGGNTVFVRRAGGTWASITVGSPFWYESTTQINMQLPPSVFGGTGGAGEIYVSASGPASPTLAFTACGAASPTCCIAATTCTMTYRSAGTHYCRNLRYDIDGDSDVEWSGFIWYTIPQTTNLCDEPADIARTCYECGSERGSCQTTPGGYVPTGSCP